MSLHTTMLESSATVTRPTTVSRDSAQGVVQNFVTIRTNLACSQQEASADVKLLYAQRDTRVSTTLYFDEDPTAEVNDYITVTDRNGYVTKYLVRGEAQPVGRGRLWSVDTERIRQPPANS